MWTLKIYPGAVKGDVHVISLLLGLSSMHDAAMAAVPVCCCSTYLPGEAWPRLLVLGDQASILGLPGSPGESGTFKGLTEMLRLLLILLSDLSMLAKLSPDGMTWSVGCQAKTLAVPLCAQTVRCALMGSKAVDIQACIVAAMASL